MRDDREQKENILQKEYRRKLNQVQKQKEKENIEEASNEQYYLKQNENLMEEKNEKNLPENVKNILGDEYELEKIPGDGSCGIGSFAKHAYNDASLGPELGRLLNKDIANDWWYYRQLVTWP